MRYGRVLLEQMAYTSQKYIAYKTDIMTGGGTRATGQKVNHLYRLRVPNWTKPDLTDENPMDVKEFPWINIMDPEICSVR